MPEIFITVILGALGVLITFAWIILPFFVKEIRDDIDTVADLAKKQLEATTLTNSLLVDVRDELRRIAVSAEGTPPP